jgi:hypothetical protein
MFTVEASMLHWQSIIFAETFFGKYAEAAENWQFVFTFRAFFKALSHTPELNVKHTKHRQSRPESVVCVCAISAL